MSEDDARVNAKREYNRQNAARARVRNKDMVRQLQEKVEFLTNRAQQLEQANEVLRAQLDVMAPRTVSISSRPLPLLQRRQRQLRRHLPSSSCRCWRRRTELKTPETCRACSVCSKAGSPT
jgi:hypothetical protein